MATVPMLRHYRVQAFLNQSDLARAAGISRQAVCRMERPGAMVRFSTIRKLASALHVHPDAIVGKVVR